MTATAGSQHGDAEDIRIRLAGPEDVDGILDALELEEFIKPLTREQLRALFTYTWVTPIRDFGVILVDGKGVHGYEGMIYSPPRMLGGQQPCITANLTTAFVQTAYRTRRTPTGVIRYSIDMIRAAMAQGFPLTVFSARGPNDIVPKLLKSLGFEQLCSVDRFYPLGAGLRSLLWPSGTISSSVRKIRPHLDVAQLKILSDHEPYGCHFFLIRQEERRCFVVTKRRTYRAEWLWPSLPARLKRRRASVSDVLHLSDPSMALESWGRLIVAACLKERTVGVTCAESILGTAAPPATSIPQRIFTYGRACSPAAIDKLYSEVVLLP